MTPTRIPLAAALLAVLLSCPAPASDCIDYDQCGAGISGWPDTQRRADDILVRDGVAYVAGGSAGFSTWSLTDPDAPVLLYDIDPGCSVTEIVLEGEYAFLAAGSCGVRIWNVADPAAPFPVSGWGSGTGIRDIALCGDALYFLEDGTSFRRLGCLDVSNRGAPVFRAPIDTFWNPASATEGELEVAGGVLLAAVNGIKCFDLADPFAPWLRDETVVHDRAYVDLDVLGSKAYVVHDEGLYVIDFSDPAGLSSAGFIDSYFLRSVACDGDRVYVATDDGRIWFYDVMNLAAPFETVYLPGSARSLTVADGRLHAAQGVLGWSVVDPVVDPDCVPLASVALDTAGSAAVEANGMLHLAGKAGVRTFDFSDPAAPAPLGLLPAAEQLQDIDTDGNVLAVAAGATGLLLATGAGTAEPVWAGSLPLNWATQVAIDADVCWVLDYTVRTLYGVDISDPAAPAVVSEIPASWAGWRLEVRDGVGYVAARRNGLAVYDLSDPLDPQVAGSPILLDDVTDVAGVGSRLYVSNLRYGVTVFDVSDPLAPVIDVQASIPGLGGAREICASAHFAYVTGTLGECFVLDVSDPVRPYVSERMELGDVANSCDLVRGRPLIATFNGGLHVLSAQCDVSHLPAPELQCVEQEDRRVFYWGLPDDPEYAESCLYRGTTEGFEPVEPLACTPDGYCIETELAHRWYVLKFRDTNGAYSASSNVVELQGAASAPDLPAAARLEISPNPFNPVTTVRFELVRAGEIELAVYDLHGRLVRRLAGGRAEAGPRTVTWDGRGDDGRTLPSGAYFVRLKEEERTQVRKATLLK